MAEDKALVVRADVKLPPELESQLAALPEEQRQQFLDFYRDELLASKQGIEFQPSRIIISKESLSYIDELGKASRELEGVIVFKHPTRGYWDPKDDETTFPMCSSLDGVYGNPDERGIAAGIAPGQECATCPFNEWGSAVDEHGNPGKGKACTEKRRLFLAIEGSNLPFVLDLPTTSIKGFDKYISARLNQGIPDIAYKTKFTLRAAGSGRETYAIAEFALGSPVSPSDMVKLAQMRSDIQLAAQKMDVGDGTDYAEDSPFDG